MSHTSVLLQEAIDGLDIHEGDIFLDCTLGSGGHSAEVARRFGEKVTIVGLDIDSAAIARSKDKLHESGTPLQAVESSFRNLDEALHSLGIANVDRILMDLGLSSDQFDDGGRGFTFQKDEPLLMTMKAAPGEGDLIAAEIVNSWTEADIADVLYTYGDERFSRRIARRIVEARQQAKILTTGDLVKIILEATPAPYHRGRIHPATRTFQALRIRVNDELAALAEGLSKAFAALNSGGRVAVISFHSGEDRIVKNFFRDLIHGEKAERVTKKPLVPTEAEIESNPRSRSAKLRIIEKI